MKRAACGSPARPRSLKSAATDRFARTELDDGLTVLSEEVPGVRSVSIGVWLRVGSVHEEPERGGSSHLLEHMVFKGSARRSARDFAIALERLGGSLDAYTSREHTCYQARVLDEHFSTAMDVLADLVLDPVLREEDLVLEREVVLEEISTIEDTPDDLVFDLHAREMWGEHPYGQPILGTRGSVAGISTQDLRDLHQRAYRRPNMLVASAGNVPHQRVVEEVSHLFERAGAGGSAPFIPPPPVPQPRTVAVERDSAQSHLVTGALTVGHGDPRRYGMVLLANALGGGMSSRLFQKIREELGLAYSVFAYQSFYQAVGVAGVYLGTRPEWAGRALEAVRSELGALSREGLSAEELEDAKSQLKGSLVLSMESTSARLHRLAAFELYGEPYRTLDELTARIDAVSLEEVAELAAEVYNPDRQVMVRLGPTEGRRN